MSSFQKIVLILTLALVPCVARADKPPGEGWTSLFNGRDLSGWSLKGIGAKEAKGIWTVVDGTIDCKPRLRPSGDKSLYSDEAFGDFEPLRRVAHQGNEGRVPDAHCSPGRKREDGRRRESHHDQPPERRLGHLPARHGQGAGQYLVLADRFW